MCEIVLVLALTFQIDESALIDVCIVDSTDKNRLGKKEVREKDDRRRDLWKGTEKELILFEFWVSVAFLSVRIFEANN